MRESATQNLCETCVTFGGKGRKREKKKDQISGRAGDDRRVIRNIYGVYGYYMSGTHPPLRRQRQGRQVSVKETDDEIGKASNAFFVLLTSLWERESRTTHQSNSLSFLLAIPPHHFLSSYSQPNKPQHHSPPIPQPPNPFFFTTYTHAQKTTPHLQGMTALSITEGDLFLWEHLHVFSHIGNLIIRSVTYTVSSLCHTRGRGGRTIWIVRWRNARYRKYGEGERGRFREWCCLRSLLTVE